MEHIPSLPDSETHAAAAGTGMHLRGWALATVLAGLMLTLLLSALDQTIVGTALPRIIGDLHGGDRYTWVITAYLLASTTMIPVIGKLSDQFGRKWFLMTGVVIFLTGSALSGASTTMNQLIIFRGLQGIGGGMLMSLIFTLIGDIFPPAERARWQGLFTGVFALASVVGPAAGGWITDHTTWRWVFYVNLPIGVLALFALFVWLPANISVRATAYRGWAAIRRIDFAGALTAALGTTCLLLGLTLGGQTIGGYTYAWSSPRVVGILIASAVFFVAFFVAERFAAEPILPMNLFRNQVFAVGALLSLFIGMALFAVAIYLPLYIQGVLGQSATNSGTVITPLTLTMAVGAAIVGLVVSRLGRYQVVSIIGAFVMAGGIYLLTRMTTTSSLFEVTRDMIVIGLGMGMLQPVMTLAVQNAIPRNRLGVGTSAVTYLRSMGSTLGTAVLGAVETNVFATQFAQRLPSAAHQLPAKLLSQDSLEAVLVDQNVKHTVVTQVTQGAVNAAVPQIVAQQVPQIVTPAAIHQAVAQALPTALQQAIPPAVATATASIPPGPQHAAQVAAVTQQVTAAVTQRVTQQVTATVTKQMTDQVTHQVTSVATTQVTHQVTTLLNQVFEAARQSLAVGVHDSFLVGLGVCGAVILLTFFLKDVPLQKRAEILAASRQHAGAATGSATGAALATPNGALPAASANGYSAALPSIEDRPYGADPAASANGHHGADAAASANGHHGADAAASANGHHGADPAGGVNPEDIVSQSV